MRCTLSARHVLLIWYRARVRGAAVSKVSETSSTLRAQAELRIVDGAALDVAEDRARASERAYRYDGRGDR